LCGGAVRAEELRSSLLYPVNNEIAPLGAKNTAATRAIRMWAQKIALLQLPHLFHPSL
jgi:hypothetical protein